MRETNHTLTFWLQTLTYPKTELTLPVPLTGEG